MWNLSSFNFPGQGSSNAQQPITGSFLGTGDLPVTTEASFVMPSVPADAAHRGNQGILQQQGNDFFGNLGGYNVPVANDPFLNRHQIDTFVPSFSHGNQFGTRQAAPNQFSTSEMETNLSAVFQNPLISPYTPYGPPQFIFAPPEENRAEIDLPDYSQNSPNPLNISNALHGFSLQDDTFRFGMLQEQRRATPEIENSESGAPLSKKPRFSPRRHEPANVPQHMTPNFQRTIKLEPSDVDNHTISQHETSSSSEVSTPVPQSSATTEIPTQKQSNFLMRTVKQEPKEKALADWDNMVKNINTVTDGIQQENSSALTKAHLDYVDDTILVRGPFQQTEEPTNPTNPMRLVPHRTEKDLSIRRLSSEREPAVFDCDTAEAVQLNDRRDFHNKNVKQELLEEQMPTLLNEPEEAIPENVTHIAAPVLKREEQESIAAQIIQGQPDAEMESIRSIPQLPVNEETHEIRNDVENGEEELIEEHAASREEEESDEESSSTITSSSEESEASVEELEDEDQECSLGEFCFVGDYFRRFLGMQVTQWVSCDRCGEWLHVCCVELNNEVYTRETFTCCGRNATANARDARNGEVFRRFHETP